MKMLVRISKIGENIVAYICDNAVVLKYDPKKRYKKNVRLLINEFCKKQNEEKPWLNATPCFEVYCGSDCPSFVINVKDCKNER